MIHFYISQQYRCRPVCMICSAYLMTQFCANLIIAIHPCNRLMVNPQYGFNGWINPNSSWVRVIMMSSIAEWSGTLWQRLAAALTCNSEWHQNAMHARVVGPGTDLCQGYSLSYSVNSSTKLAAAGLPRRCGPGSAGLFPKRWNDEFKRAIAPCKE